MKDPSYLSAYEDVTECSEMSAYKIQTHGELPEETIRHSEHGEKFEIKNGTAGRVTVDNVTGRMRFACRINKATDIHS